MGIDHSTVGHTFPSQWQIFPPPLHLSHTMRSSMPPPHLGAHDAFLPLIFRLSPYPRDHWRLLIDDNAGATSYSSASAAADLLLNSWYSHRALALYPSPTTSSFCDTLIQLLPRLCFWKYPHDEVEVTSRSEQSRRAESRRLCLSKCTM